MSYLSLYPSGISVKINVLLGKAIKSPLNFLVSKIQSVDWRSCNDADSIEIELVQFYLH
jgi:hypothetical protein